MHVVRFTDAPAYTAKNHAGVNPHRIQGRDAGGPASMAVSISEYPPGCGGQSAIGESEVVYLVIEGTMRVGGGVGEEEEVELGVGDSASFAAGEPRSARNAGSEQPASSSSTRSSWNARSVSTSVRDLTPTDASVIGFGYEGLSVA